MNQNTLEYLLQRYSDSGESTLGIWMRREPQGVLFQAHTLEDEHRDVKVPGETRIPADLYELRLRQFITPLTAKYRARFPWFQWHVEVIGVRGFSNIYVHVGEHDGHTNGCILMADNVNNNRVRKGRLLESAVAYERWYREVYAHLNAGGRALLEVRDENFLARAA